MSPSCTGAVCGVALSVDLVGYHCNRLDFDLGAVLDQARYLQRRHGRKVPAYDVAIGRADFLQARRIFLAVEQEPRHRHDMLGPGAAGTHHRIDVLQGLADLIHQIVGLELALFVPADLACDEDHLAAGGDAVRVTARLGPTGRLQDLEHFLTPRNRTRLDARAGLSHLQDVASDNEFLDFGRAFIDAQRAYLAAELPDAPAGANPAAAEHLHGAVDYFLRCFGRDDLRHRGFARRGRFLHVAPPGRAI